MQVIEDQDDEAGGERIGGLRGWRGLHALHIGGLARSVRGGVWRFRRFPGVDFGALFYGKTGDGDEFAVVEELEIVFGEVADGAA